MQIPITQRLKTVADMIEKTGILCDIGCDHGYLPIYLLQQQKIQYAYACDVRDGPLKNAAKNIAAFHMKNHIQTVKSNGLKELSDKKFDVISICGMGGRLIANILAEEPDIARRAKYLVLQPQSEIPVLRRFLAEHHFMIREERIAVEDRRFYVLMSVSDGEEVYQDELSYQLGRHLLTRNDDLTKQYLAKEYKRFQMIMAARGGRENAPEIDKIICELEKYM